MVISELRKNGQKTSKKDAEKFGYGQKSATFAPAIKAEFLRHFEAKQIKKIFEKKLKKDLDCKE
ncbi:hypothetical protein ABGT15_13765 [Flavobacterium enshiense]|uniref:hypothetical protein n=1 Tax=Flavobacterium enshiense TaxID=1341165 RepID=UPI00345CA91B